MTIYMNLSVVPSCDLDCNRNTTFNLKNKDGCYSSAKTYPSSRKDITAPEVGETEVHFK